MNAKFKKEDRIKNTSSKFQKLCYFRFCLPRDKAINSAELPY